MGVFSLFRNKKKEESNKPTSRFIDDEWVEVSAGSKEEAIERACVALNTNPSHLEINMLSKDGKKLRARKAPAGQQAKPQQRAPQARPQQRPQQSRPARKPADQDRQQRRPQPSRVEETTDEMHANDGEYRSDENYDDRGGSNHNDRNNEQYNARRNNHRQEEDTVEEIEEETDLGRKAKEVLSQIVVKIEANSTVELYETNKTIRLEIISSESGLFIGKFGQTLDSIQHILKKILEIKFEDGKNLVVDAEEYRVRREETIETKARKLAKKARQEGRPVSVEPMNAMDRRIVHMALKGEPGIETKSVGEGSTRRVLIVPKRRSSSGRDGGRNDGGRGRGPNPRGPARGRSDRDRPPAQARDGNARVHDSYDVPALSKSEVFGDNPEEYFSDDEK